MIEVTRGSKRRLSDADENERITLRQTVLNMSICKLQKDHGRKEPSLLRCVVITNTVRLIEKEMDEEMQFDYQDDCFPPLSSSVAEYPSPFPANLQNKTSTEKLKADLSLMADATDMNFVSQGKDHGNAVINSLSTVDEQQLDTSGKSNKFGAIGDHRKHKVGGIRKDDSLQSVAVSSSGWDGFASLISNVPFESITVETKLPAIDIGLYDFDALTAVPVPLSIGSDEWRYLPSTCASEYDRRKPDSFFEDLDQIMQVLVGM